MTIMTVPFSEKILLVEVAYSFLLFDFDYTNVQKLICFLISVSLEFKRVTVE